VKKNGCANALEIRPVALTAFSEAFLLLKRKLKKNTTTCFPFENGKN
jgi:hypothetical protein